MEERTRAYLRGRFSDYYRRADLTPPPAADAREWGYIPWTPGPDTTMVRHRALLDLGDLGEFLARERPRHVYFSAGRYEDPGAGSMAEKEWVDSDLVFDLDADHLPSVTLGEDSYAEMLEKCKEELHKLLGFLEEEFAFEDLTVAFSGGRGYHVHVRDEAVRGFESEARREVVDYIRGTGLSFDALLDRETVAGSGLKNPTEKRLLPTDGGWGRRVHRRLLAVVDELREADEESALDRLQSRDGIGEQKARAILRVAEENYDAIREGNLDVHPAFVGFARQVTAETTRADHAHIDEPVTTDVNRLIRLPGSLHGGTGLRVTRIDRDGVDAFDPLTAAVPETFVGHEVTVDVAEDGAGPVELGGQSFTVSAGMQTVPEYVAVFLMARGRAEKGKE